jgi:hypothetical protein
VLGSVNISFANIDSTMRKVLKRAIDDSQRPAEDDRLKCYRGYRRRLIAACQHTSLDENMRFAIISIDNALELTYFNVAKC